MNEYTPPENIHGPVIRKVMRPLAEAIQKESGASKVIVVCRYELAGKKENMAIKMQVSNDSCMERHDSTPPRPLGNKLAADAELGVKKILGRKPKGE